MPVHNIYAEGMIGQSRRFVTTGSVYEVLGVVRSLANGDTLLRVRIIETGEEVEYSYLHAMDDPREN